MRMNKLKIGKIGNYDGKVYVKETEGSYFWGVIDEMDFVVDNIPSRAWEEIPKSLYDELIKFEKSCKVGT